MATTYSMRVTIVCGGSIYNVDNIWPGNTFRDIYKRFGDFINISHKRILLVSQGGMTMHPDETPWMMKWSCKNPLIATITIFGDYPITDADINDADMNAVDPLNLSRPCVPDGTCIVSRGF